jgi:FMN-dependent NADH-azoreductase
VKTANSSGPTLLEIESSPLGNGASISRQLTGAFVQQWRQAHPDGTVITRDLSTSRLPTVTAEWIIAMHTPSESRTEQQRDSLVLSDMLIGELKAADEYVFGVPMHNFGIPAVLKLWIDQVARAGETFAYADGAPKGLLTGKKAHFLIATGGVYAAGSPMGSYNFVEPYLRALFGFLGVTDTHFVTAGGTAAVRTGKIDRETLLAPRFAEITNIVRAA